MNKYILASSVSLLTIAAFSNANAQSNTRSAEQATRVDEIIVTAQRREQASQDVGVSLSVVGGEQLDEKGISVVNDLENAVPNMEVDSQFGGGQPQFRIRGIGAREYSSNNASTVGIYEGLRAVMPNNPQVKFFDSRPRGYMSIDVRPDRMDTRYQVISDVRDPAASLSTLKSWTVESGRPGAVAA